MADEQMLDEQNLNADKSAGATGDDLNARVQVLEE
ncbi:MAG: nucleotide exchange factor GrpE, partial [Pseudomonas sp.]|nr:nucleotide exchange factor GrpE [Pseudomonas sp.]